MTLNEIDLLDKETRISDAFQIALGLLDPKQDRDPAKAQELLDFLSEEYASVRKALMDRVALHLQQLRS